MKRWCWDYTGISDAVLTQEQMLLTKDSLSQNMEAIKRKYEVRTYATLDRVAITFDRHHLARWASTLSEETVCFLVFKI